jgi:glycosyltransferase involved in cell wall biosynthesis
MRLLVTTQAVDRNDPILGFFHNWIVALAPHFTHIHVICLREGEHNLPPNVVVHSLGKEHGENRVRYVWRTFRYAWGHRREYDAVFSHMNPHYIVLMGWLWRLMGKRMYFWRNHAKMNLMTRIAAFFAARVFYTSPHACTRIFKHAMQMPVGIDTECFKPDVSVTRKEHTVLLLGRLSPVKRPESFMDAASVLPDFEFHSYGDDPSSGGAYKQELETRAKRRVTFHPSIPNHETPAIYSQFDIYVNLTPEGSMDKTVLEAAACGALVLVANRSYETFLPAECMIDVVTPGGIARGIERLASLTREQKESLREELRTMVEREHSLIKLTERFVTIFNDTAS